MLIPAHEFALAVVSSSSPELSIADKIALYEKAFEEVVEHNKQQPKSSKAEVQLFKESL